MPSRRNREAQGGGTYRSSNPPSESPVLGSGRRSGLSMRGGDKPAKWWPPGETNRGSSSGASRVSASTPLGKCLSQRLETGRSRVASERSSNGSARHMAVARSTPKIHELNKEVGRVYNQVAKDVGFNMEDIYHGHEAQRIVEDREAEARGVVHEHARILHNDTIQAGKHFKHEREPSPDAKDMWRQNRNPGLKWWQNGPLTEMSPTQLKNNGLDNTTSAHPAYFLLRRGNPGLKYVEKPTFKTRSELLAQRKEAMKPDASFDLDGDGVVGVREFYFAARMDKDASGTLNVEEKLEGLQDMRQNMNKIMFVDNAGKAHERQAGNQYRIIQQDGQIILDQQ